MIEIEETESGFIGGVAEEETISSEMSDIEIISISGINIIARGKRFGRFWLLKGLIPEMRETPSSRRMLQKEFELHSRLLHSNIVRVSSFEEMPNLGVCIVEEWVEGETLAELLKKGNLSKTERRRILRDIILVVGYMHSVGVVHRDLKPQNIMVRKEGGEVVVIDFGLADSGDYAELKQGAGSKGYISPEQMTEGGARTTDDIYSLGGIIRDLCPEYRRIADRCTGPLERRPKSTAAVIKMLDRYDRRPKLVAWGVAAVLLAAVVGAASLHVSTITAESKEAKVQIDTLTNINERNIARVDEMGDLLEKMKWRVHIAMNVLGESREDRGRRRRVIIDSYRKYEDAYLKFEREELPHMDFSNQEVLQKSMQDMFYKCQYIYQTAYDLEKYPELVGVDSLMLAEEVKSLGDQLHGLYYTAWQMQKMGKQLKDAQFDYE